MRSFSILTPLFERTDLGSNVGKRCKTGGEIVEFCTTDDTPIQLHGNTLQLPFKFFLFCYYSAMLINILIEWYLDRTDLVAGAA